MDGKRQAGAAEPSPGGLQDASAALQLATGFSLPGEADSDEPYTSMCLILKSN